LWFGTNGGGVSKYDGKSFINFTVKQGLANNFVLSIAEDKNGNLWFGTNGGGVSKYDGKSFINFTVEQGLANNYVYSIAEDKNGNLWFGTNQGLTVVLYGSGVSSNNTNEIKMRNITKQLKNLPDKVIGGIQIDHRGRMLLGTNFGLYVLSAQDVENLVTSLQAEALEAKREVNLTQVEGTVYNQFTGYPVKDLNYGGNNNGATCIDKNGIFWVGHGSNGVTRVDLDAVNKSSAAPKVVINKVSLKGEDVCFYSLLSPLEKGAREIENSQRANSSNPFRQRGGTDSTIIAQQEVATYGNVLPQAERDTLSKRFAGVTFDGITSWYPLPENLMLPYEHNALTFEFNAIETGRNFLVNYQFALTEGSPPQTGAIEAKGGVSAGRGGKIEWSPITKKHEATYNNLWEGEYAFLLKAESPWGVWSEPIVFKFTVLPPWYRTWWAYLSYAVAGLLVIWLLIQMQTRKLKEEQKILEQKVEEATVELRVKNDELGNKNAEIESQKGKVEKVLIEVEEAHEQLAEHHKEITDSINYAKRIQDAMLKSEEHNNEHLPEHYILFKPKDVVSGDYYWALEKQGYLYITSADCTGHGVPGAFMSMLGMSFLNEINSRPELLTPAQILDELRERVMKELGQTGAEGESKDGMDMSLMRIKLDGSNELMWSGAYNPLYHIKALDGKEIEKDVQSDTYYVSVIDADKQSIGFGYNMKPFTNHTIMLKQGESIVLFTDGFADQFGGPRGKKFKYKPYKRLLLDVKDKPMQEQKSIIDKSFEDWRGEQEQVDDVCVIGMRV
ncbi:MAG: SpoIIE family protein phosphatase, partial [Flavobacteriales bacterium]|nr:SpoIIE family protein phosphatase [Flavobacteriales bacterium]